ncbi:MAG: B12-binding domain-containing radical SAM protein [Clostridia bacterium]|nr:B12-binding domain-containing radical SAM protein [Clostridia bacterium]
MKALICAINSKFIHSSLAVWCLAGGIEEFAPTVKYNVLEGTINENKEDIIEKILSYEFDIIGISVYIWNKSLAFGIAEEIKKKTGAYVVLGGPEVSYNVTQIFEECPSVDAIISGEGEEAFARLCQGEDPSLIEGVSYKKCGQVVEKPTFVSAKDPPTPYVKRYFEALNGRIAYIETSRGCPFKCAFCLSGRCGGVRFFDLEKAKKNIVLLANSGTQTVKFIDRTFNADRKRAREIFQFIIDNYQVTIPRGVRFHFEIEGELLDDETISVLSKAPIGLFQFEIGLQSFNEKTLNFINRKTNLELLQKNIEKVISLKNIHVHIDLIVGLPYEDYNSFASSFNQAYKLKPHMLQIGFLKLLHGAEMRENKEKYKTEFTDTPPYEIVSNQWIGEEELKMLHSFEDAFERLYNSGRFPRTCVYLNGLFDDTFSMIEGFSKYVEAQRAKLTLDNFTSHILDYFSSIKCCDKSVLRDCLAQDRLSTNKMGYLPDFLKIHSPEIKRCLNELEKQESTKRRKGVKRACTILPSENKIAYVDYDTPHPVTGCYEIKYIPISIK